MSFPCPKFETLSRAFPRGPDRFLASHLEGCPACAQEWARLGSVVGLARALPVRETSSDDLERLRSRLLITANSTPRVSSDRRDRIILGGTWAAVAAALLLLFLHRMGTFDTAVPTAPQPVLRASVLNLGDARFVHQKTPAESAPRGDEVLRLRAGRLHVAVEPLQRQERFRVITNDAEIEVRGTAFEVRVVDDELESVIVESGLVEVRFRDHAVVKLRAGEHWNRAKALEGRAPNPTPPSRIEAVHAPATEAARAPDLESDTRTSELGAPAFEAARLDPETVERVEAETAALIKDEAPPGGPRSQATAEAERLFALGWADLESGREISAAARFEAAIMSDPYGPRVEDATYWRAISLARSGRSNVARAALEDFLQRYSRSDRVPEAMVILGWIRVDDGDEHEAFRLFLEASERGDGGVRRSAAQGLKRLRGND